VLAKRQVRTSAEGAGSTLATAISAYRLRARTADGDEPAPPTELCSTQTASSQSHRITFSVAPTLASRAAMISVALVKGAVRVLATFLTSEAYARAVMCRAAEQAATRCITNVRPRITRATLARLPQHSLVAHRTRCHGERTELTGRCRSPCHQILDGSEVHQQPWTPQIVVGGDVVATMIDC
jgi:hypothetical protein